jgi:type VI secretion system protein ImpF
MANVNRPDLNRPDLNRPDLKRDERLQPSLLDRLTDLAPGEKRETLDQQTLTMSQLRRAVLRDLGWLLNASNLATVEDLGDYRLVSESTLNYGIPGFAGRITSGGRAGALEEAIADAIRAFEPRIRAETLRVHARPQQDDEPLPTLVFEISGELWAQPVPQQLFVETSIELGTRLAVVSEFKGRA